MKTDDRLNKAYGALMGVAVGDAMGMPTESWTRRRIKKHFGKVDTFLPGPEENAITKGLKAGQVTDDTLATVIIAESIIGKEGKILPSDIIERLIDWADSNKSVSCNVIGPSTRKAFELIGQGAPIEEAGKNGVTNGGAMRIIPVGIISDWRNPDALVGNVRLACLATHNTNIAIAGAAAVAAAVSYCIDGYGDLDEMMEIVKKVCEKAMEFGYEMPGASIAKRIQFGMEIVNKGQKEEEILQNISDMLGTGVAVTESVPAALSLVFLAKGNPVECARFAANIGGDTDTIGAMACGISGAFRGIEAFPEDTTQLITETNQFDLKGIAHKLLMYRT